MKLHFSQRAKAVRVARPVVFNVTTSGRLPLEWVWAWGVVELSRRIVRTTGKPVTIRGSK